MQVLTETVLRASHPERGGTVTVSKDAFITETARRYAEERGIRIVCSEWGSMTRKKIDTKTDFPYIDAESGEKYREKPEGMTHISANRLVKKNHPRIAFRGKLDYLQSEIILLQYECDKYGEKGMLGKLTELLELSRTVLACEVKDEALPEFCLFGMDAQQLRHASHDVVESMGMEHPIPDYRMGILCAKLNRLRTIVRETELYAVNAFPDDERKDIVLALNRMSSAVYLMFLESVKKHSAKEI